MQATFTLSSRDGGSSLTVSLIVTLLVLIIVSIGSVGALWFLRRTRRTRNAALLPVHGEVNEKLSAPNVKGHRRLSSISVSSNKGSFAGIRRASSKFVDEEKRDFMATTSAPPPTDKLPQIRITFPEEVDDAGKRQNARSVLIHIDEKGAVGMEPIRDEETLPPYEAGNFVSLDLDRMGGLEEKEKPQGQQATMA